MHLCRLELEEFRAYQRLSLRFDERGLLLHGLNASGKSSLLESIMMLATTRSPRAGNERDVIRQGSGETLGVPPFARLSGIVRTNQGEQSIEITLETTASRDGPARKRVRLNGRAVRSMDAVGQLKAVLFSPEDVALVTGSPSPRRRYLDMTISQTSGAYLRSLSRFGRVLEQRNGLLKQLQRDRVAPNSGRAAAELAFWDEEFAVHGSAIIARRQMTIEQLANLARDWHRRLTGGEDFALAYLPSLEFVSPPVAGPDDFERIQSVVHRELSGALAHNRTADIRRGASLIGPHRDDLGFRANSLDLAVFGSRGQQRIAVIALKLAEMSLMQAIAGEPPVLLLDDVLSELDPVRRRFLAETAARIEAQVIVTGADTAEWIDEWVSTLPRASVENGQISPL